MGAYLKAKWLGPGFFNNAKRRNPLKSIRKWNEQRVCVHSGVYVREFQWHTGRKGSVAEFLRIESRPRSVRSCARAQGNVAKAWLWWCQALCKPRVSAFRWQWAASFKVQASTGSSQAEPSRTSTGKRSIGSHKQRRDRQERNASTREDRENEIPSHQQAAYAPWFTIPAFSRSSRRRAIRFFRSSWKPIRHHRAARL